MRNVSKEVKKVLNEGFNFEPAYAFEAFVKAFADARLKDVIDGSECEDIKNLVKECHKMLVNDNVPAKAPMKISSMSTLAAYILVKHFNEDACKELKEADNAGIADIANCVCAEINGEDCDCNNEEPEKRDDIESKSQYNDQMHNNLPARRTDIPECGGNKKTANECGDSKTNECGNSTTNECGGKKTNECNESFISRRRRFRRF